MSSSAHLSLKKALRYVRFLTICARNAPAFVCKWLKTLHSVTSRKGVSNAWLRCCLSLSHPEQGERNVCGLYCLSYHAHQPFLQLNQIHLILQRCAKGGKRARGIVFVTIEAPVNHGLNTFA